jgi:nitrite reductase/ring-hydroxylating ferredoxin subunit/uncharacterized membrane protein
VRSKVQVRGHPLHPMLIPFPLAFLTGAFAADVAGTLLDVEGLWITAYYLSIGGVAMGVLAAVPGLIDYRYVVPPRSSGKRRATMHLLVNVAALLLFALAWIVRGAAEIPPDPATLLVEGIAVALLLMGGWMGGTLVYRNQIGIDHRYAEAGKWKEARVPRRAGEAVVADADELQVDQMKLLRVGERRIVLARTEEGYVAFDDRCTHRGGSLAGGLMSCGTVHCPWHGSQFDVRSGEVRAGPATEPIGTYAVRQEGGKVHLVLGGERT